MIPHRYRQFPKAWYGVLLLVLAPMIALIGMARLFSPLHSAQEQDIDTVIFSLLVGCCVGMVGLVFLVISARRFVKSDGQTVHYHRGNTPIADEESVTLQRLFLITATILLLGLADHQLWAMSSVGLAGHPPSVMRKVVVLATGYLVAQFPFLIGLYRIRAKLDQIGVTILLSYACARVLTDGRVFFLLVPVLAWYGLTALSEIALAIFAWKARSLISREEGQNGLMIACFFVCLIYAKLNFFLSGFLCFRLQL